MTTQGTISPLPPTAELESRSVLKSLAPAHRYLAELKGMAATIPNEHILINTLILQEAKDSSEIENVVTTHDDLYKADLFGDYIKNPAAKEVNRYATALKNAFEQVKHDRLLTVNRIVGIHRVLEQNEAGIRKLPGTALKNERTGETVYTPPQDHGEIVRLMNNLEQFINDDELSNVDPLVKMAVIHYQFESIHPFYDGNGRTGRIINIIYLVARGLLDIPVLYLSRYIIRNKADYYRLLQATRDTGDWEPWILYMLEGVELTSRQTIWIIQRIKEIMMAYKHRILTNGDGCRLIFMDWRRGVVYRMLRCRFLCLGRWGRSGGISHAQRLGNRKPIRIWPGNRMGKQRWITHGLADGPTSGDGENGIPGQETSPMSRLQTIQGNHDMTLANKPSRGVPRLLNSDGEQSCGLRASRKQDIHGNCWKSGFSRG